MKRCIIFAAAAFAAAFAFAQSPKRDISVVRNYIRSCVGDGTIEEIKKREGGTDFLKKFFADQTWMEEFAGSGTWGTNPWKGLNEENELSAKALLALDLLVWNDEDGFIEKPIGRKIATALALDHGADWDDVKLVRVMECYREWAAEGTLHADAWKHDVRKWREVLGFGQNAPLSVENLRWIHDFANVPAGRYYGVCWRCAYRLFNCFGASVHGPEYYRPWHHRWNTQELRYRVGGVCGALSKFGSHAAASHGIRSFTAGQPGHCAYVLWDYKEGRWGIAYAVTGHTAPHNTLGGQGFPALEEIDRYYEHPRRWEAEYLRWQGKWEESLLACPGNWCAAVSWWCDMGKRNAPQSEYDKWAAAVRKSFANAPGEGWQLYIPYLERIKGRDERLAAAVLGVNEIREFKGKTAEAPYLDEMAFNTLGNKLFKDDDDAAWKLFEASLDGQAGTPTFYRQTIAWGSNRLMKGPEATKRFLATVGKSAQKTGAKLDFKSMIIKASKSGDIATFKQVYQLMDKLEPSLAPKKRANGGWPEGEFGGKLLSADGMLQTSGTSNWESPVTYRNALDAADFEAGNAFHTGGEKAPWGMVILPGVSEISGIIVANIPGQNAHRQAPLRIWASEDGTNFKEVYASDQVLNEWRCAFTTPIKAKYIKVGRAPDAKSEVFHLRKILVYGKKLY
ncbi:MAG: discoidin domain-containing protein [Kiritimatiellae bacterium]|nr:discoidin domain-containing protein [Kiritimatiellia bacterium]